MKLKSNAAVKGLLIFLLMIAFTGCETNSRMAVNSELEIESQVPQEPASGPEVNCEAALGQWRSFRLERGEIVDSGMYDQGFLKGCTGPAGLVDSSNDFNLGHSDGMLAAVGKHPGETEESQQ